MTIKERFAWRVVIVIAVLTSAAVTIPTVLAISNDRKNYQENETDF